MNQLLIDYISPIQEIKNGIIEALFFNDLGYEDESSEKTKKPEGIYNIPFGLVLKTNHKSILIDFSQFLRDDFTLYFKSISNEAFEDEVKTRNLIEHNLFLNQKIQNIHLLWYKPKSSWPKLSGDQKQYGTDIFPLGLLIQTDFNELLVLSAELYESEENEPIICLFDSGLLLITNQSLIENFKLQASNIE